MGSRSPEIKKYLTTKGRSTYKRDRASQKLERQTARVLKARAASANTKKAKKAGKAARARKKARVKKTAQKTKKAAKKAPAKKRTPNAAFMRALTPSAALAAVVGATPLARTEVVSKMWTYIKKHGLQDKVNKRNINADDKLRAVFGKAQVTMFELASLIGKHLK